MRIRKVKNFPGYLITSCGSVWSCKSNKFLKKYSHPQGYLLISLSIEGKNYKRYVHRLVADSFIGNPDSLKEVNHIDGNKENNHLNNLEWITRSNNVIHAYTLGLAKRKLTEEDVTYILNDSKTTVKEKAVMFKCSEENIRGILSNRNWKHISREAMHK